MLKLLKGECQPPTIINTDLIKFIQLDKLGKRSSIVICMNDDFSNVLNVDYDLSKYSSEIEAMENFLIFLNGPETSTDQFGIYPVKLG